jgi:DNA ligase-associated metallophosphoesterase
MNDVPVIFAGTSLTLRPSGALWWADARLLCVSDMHLGKSERMARRGGPLLPPFESRDTLSRLDAEVSALDPARVICLGDSFDDLSAARALPEEEKLWITRLMAGRDWIWIEGNHDPGPLEFGGTHRAALTLDGLIFRHIPEPGAGPAEISGHYHPKVVLHARGRTVRRRCFLMDDRRLILPAFGTFTGGLKITDPVFAALFGAGTRAVLTGPTMSTLPVDWKTA